ncbi:dethiobiotin synthase [Echinicola jeungdonensis]|uniref:ATP-dependent dethiobiotin synthetase BioD n=1 Tax=Echinicola jeungdonensis TaxID=709343 RepID=A0ABV5J3Z6_9BACT|nr:dethiobiotin synthase [Echinicola jeungdonensis]MDN3668200.1 dethiobiotin synthase [Echinicola jeungdonensis]MDN3671224.1 dethiobiotin synthase [Echinicola jeungdonensis]MDN3671236.1 dethiobiotin synthase [Echinicola jeungdonensis]
MKDKIFVTGIGTGIGKTVVSASICKTFGHAYWKPVQCGDLDESDSHFVAKHVPHARVHLEAYRLETPQSPHWAAEIENTQIDLNHNHLPSEAGKLCVEGAGGLMVPLNDQETYLDFLLKTDLHPVVVIRHYLGSINHSMLTLKVLENAGFKDFTIIWNGYPVPSSESAILQRFCPSQVYRLEEWENQNEEIPKLMAENQ